MYICKYIYIHTYVYILLFQRYYIHVQFLCHYITYITHNCTLRISRILRIFCIWRALDMYWFEYLHIYKSIYTYIYIYIYMYSYFDIDNFTYTYVCVRMWNHFNRYVYIYMYTYTYIGTGKQQFSISTLKRFMFIGLDMFKCLMGWTSHPECRACQGVDWDMGLDLQQLANRIFQLL